MTISEVEDELCARVLIDDSFSTVRDRRIEGVGHQQPWNLMDCVKVIRRTSNGRNGQDAGMNETHLHLLQAIAAPAYITCIAVLASLWHATRRA